MSNASQTINSLSPEARNLLVCCWSAALDAAGGDFGFSSEAFDEWRHTRPEGTLQQFAGLYGALVSKGLMYSDDEAEVNGKLLGESQYDFPEDVREYLFQIMG